MAILNFKTPSEEAIREEIRGCREWFRQNPKRTSATAGMFYATSNGGSLIFKIRAACIEEDVRAAARDPNRALGKEAMEAQAEAVKHYTKHESNFQDPLKPRRGPTRKLKNDHKK